MFNKATTFNHIVTVDANKKFRKIIGILLEKLICNIKKL